MGINYYLHDLPNCSCCGQPVKKPLHIGKSSGGWCFTLHVIPEEGLGSLYNWILRMGKPQARILDEDGEAVPLGAMIAIITKRRAVKERCYTTPAGYRSWDEFYKKNDAEPGPEGLLRHKIDGKFCIAHGDGTYDLAKGYFR